MSIVGIVAAPSRAAALRRPATSGGFRIDDQASPAPAAAVAAPAALQGLLSLQEAEGDAAQDHAARRHAGSVLAALSAVQRALLGSDGGALASALLTLDGLVRRSPAALDPQLGAIIRTIALRAAIEAARYDLQKQYPAAAG